MSAHDLDQQQCADLRRSAESGEIAVRHEPKHFVRLRATHVGQRTPTAWTATYRICAGRRRIPADGGGTDHESRAQRRSRGVGRADLSPSGSAAWSGDRRSEELVQTLAARPRGPPMAPYLPCCPQRGDRAGLPQDGGPGPRDEDSQAPKPNKGAIYEALLLFFLFYEERN